jgi:hypothetical protein
MRAVVMNGTAFGPLVRRLGLCPRKLCPPMCLTFVADRRSTLIAS